jgi:hypothetical protein
VCGNTAAGLHRRRNTSRRLTPLECGCADPWPCTCNDDRPSERMIDAGAHAARHLLELGHVPLLKSDVLEALYRRGGDDRELAQHLYQTCGGES